MKSKSRKTLLRTALLMGAAGAVTVAGMQAGCSSPGANEPSGPNAPSGDPGTSNGDTGTVGALLTIPGGEKINTVSYSITQGGNPVKSATIDVSNSAQISFLVGGLAAGGGYSITLTGTTTDGTITCTGSATFSITARSTTNVNIILSCTVGAADAGTAHFTGTLADCATAGSVSASPSEVNVGGTVALSATATAPDPTSVTFAWSASSGTFDNASSATPNFTCAAAGLATITVAVGDGALPDGATCGSNTATVQVQCDAPTTHVDKAAALPTATKIKHVVVIFNENISYDHYFATYPGATNPSGDPAFNAASGTPSPNNLATPLDPTNGFTPITSEHLITNNPTASNAGNGTGATNPFRLGPAQAWTNDQGHNYAPEQKAEDNGAMDLFPEFTGTAGPPPGTPDAGLTTGLVMAYFDGNTLGTYWNWAQNYSMNDNSWSTTFGPSTPGAINLISGQTNGLLATNKDPSTFSTSHLTPDGNGGWTLIGDTDPLNDVCSTSTEQTSFVGKNVGDLLNAGGVSWGWFEGGFDLTLTNGNTTTGCNRSTPQTVPGATTISTDYIPHHAPFQYYPSTANLTHARPSAVAAVGSSLEADGHTAEPANHQYDSHDFFDALNAGNLPAVVYLKAPAFQDGHAGYSNPTDEQHFAASVVAALQGAQEWATTAVVLAYDDSDGWYDHQASPIVNQSNGTADFLNGSGHCTSGVQQTGAAPGTALLGAVPADGGAPAPVLGRCGYGTRQPLMVISPFAKKNFVDHTLTDQTSILKFVEDNWLGGQRIQPGGSFDTIANPITNMLSGI
ncbi:MAG TPA: alkaline phosphatase family protein [Polyangiaceae bacterium]|jgi:phospholipase C|nr:alkaline phosphatase family protein [Polyangiaceae bacterium]